MWSFGFFTGEKNDCDSATSLQRCSLRTKSRQNRDFSSRKKQGINREEQGTAGNFRERVVAVLQYQWLNHARAAGNRPEQGKSAHSPQTGDA
jgi:hypothetical protein